MNPFQDTYQNRLKSWRDLRSTTSKLPLDQACVQIDRWWQQAPLVNHHYHWNDIENWSEPWTMLSENEYCVLTRAIGMCYTLLMNGVDDIELVTATDSQCEEHYLVLVGDYILNYWPNTVLTNKVSDFTTVRHLNMSLIKDKLQ
jgi:hypothetical protein